MSSASFRRESALVTSGPCANGAGYRVFDAFHRSTKSHLDMMRDAIVSNRQA